MKKSRLFLNILGALGAGIMIPGVVIGTVSCSNNSTSQNQNNNNNVFLENISDIEKGGEAEVVTEGVATAFFAKFN